MPTLKDIYNSFRENKQQPVLLLMLAGIVAVLFGFGYLLKVYLIDNIQQITFNISLLLVFGFALSAAFFIAALLLNKNEKYKNFSSAVMSLSILLNFMLIYFLSLIGQSKGHTYEFFIGTGIFANIVIAIYFTVKSTDRLLALLSITGGVFAPLFFQPLSSGEPQYFIYLFLIAAAAIYIGYSLHWNMIVMLAFLAVNAIIEFLIFDIGNMNFFSEWYVFIFHGFAYLFVAYNMLIPAAAKQKDKETLSFSEFFTLSPRNELQKQNLFMLLTAVSLLLFNLFFYFGSAEKYNVLGFYYIFNALPFGIAFAYYRKHKIRTIQMASLSVGAIILMFGLFSLAIDVSQIMHYIGLLIAAEALIFIYLGYNYQLHEVRRYAYLAFLLSTIFSLWQLRILVSGSYNELLNYSYFNLVGMGLSIVTLNAMSWWFEPQNKKYENRLRYLSDELISLWITVVSLITTLYYLPQWLTLITIIPTFYLFYRARIRDLVFTRLIAYIIFIILLSSSSYWVIVDMGKFWGKPGFYFSHPFWNFFVAGGMFFSFIFWKRYLLRLTSERSQLRFKDLENRNALLRIAKSAFFLWAAALILIITMHENREAIHFVGVIPIGLLILGGYKEKLILVRYAGYALLLTILGSAGAKLYDAINNEWEWVIVSEGYFYLIWAIILVITILTGINYANKHLNLQLSEIQITDINKILGELISILITIAAVIFAYYQLGSYAYTLCPVAIAGLLYLGHHRYLVMTELIGLFFYIVLAYGLYDTYQTGNGLLSQDFRWYVIGAETYFLLWAAKYFYYRFLPENIRTDTIELLHDIFYFLMPIIVVFFAYKKIGEYMPFVLWGTVVLTFVLAEITNNKSIFRKWFSWLPPIEDKNAVSRPIIYQWYLWLAVASAYSAWHYDFLILIAGLVALWLLVIYKKGVTGRIQGKVKYRFLSGYTYLYTIFVVFTAYYHTEDQIIGGLLLASLLLLMLVFLKHKIFAARTVYKLAYRLSFFILIYTVWQLANSYEVIPNIKTSYTAGVLETVLLPVNLIIISYLLMGKHYIYSKKNPPVAWRIDMFVLHLLYMGTYIFFVRLFFTDLKSVALTVAWFIHAIQLMFYSIKPKYKFLSKLSYLMFFFAVLKFIFYDSDGLERTQFVITLMLLGLIFIGSSFLFVKLKDRFERKAQKA